MNMVGLKKYRGLLWKKMKESEKRVADLPGFRIEEIKEFKELPTFKDVSDIDVKYPLIEPFAYAHIKWDPSIQQVVYILEEPQLTEEEKKVLKQLHNTLIDMIQVGLSSVKSTTEATKYLEDQFKKAITNMGISLTAEQYTKFMYFIFRDFVGFNEIEPMLKDPYIEDIGCDGVGIPLYVVHRKYGSIKTNIGYEKLEHLREFVIKLAERTGRYVSYAEPILDGTLPDGSRVNASLAGDVTTRGPTFSIRKFAEKPFSPIDLIELGTVTPELMAYFWFLVESGASLLIGGGVATGKTTFLNSICMFIPPEAKIVSIEDSVTGDTEIITKMHDEIKLVPIGELVDRLLSEDGKHEKVGNKKGVEVLTLDGDYKMKFRHVGSFMRHKVKKDVYEITTSTGRKIKVTQDHSLFGLDEYGRIIPVTPKQLEKIKFLAVPRLIPWEGKELKTINLIEHLDAFKGDFIKGPLEKIFERNGFDRFKKWGISEQKYRYWKKHNIIETSVFKKLLADAVDIDLKGLYIISKRESKPLPVLFRVTDEFLELLGLWVGDGSYDMHNKNRVIVSNADKGCIDCVKKVAKGLGIKVSLMNDKVSNDKVSMSLNSTLFYKLMRSLGFKGYSNTKRVPGLIFNLSKKQAASFLRGYFSADGSPKTSEITCSSQSLGLLNDIQTLLLRFGIISRIFHYPRKDGCRELSISSNDNVTKFEEIGFLQKRKLSKVGLLTMKKSTHATTDVIPLGSGLLQEINRFHKLSWSYQQGLYNIGREFLTNISGDVDSDIVERLANSDILLDKIKGIKKLPKKEIYVYDLSVPETENFVGANIILHNTRELRLTHEHWIPTVSRLGFGIPLPTGEKYGEITLFDLLKGSFRQNPDYVIVGEVRGREAYVMFQGMSSVPGWERISLLNDMHFKRVQIDSIVPRKGFRIFSIDPKTERIKMMPIKAKFSHRPRKQLFKIKTKTGREVLVTSDHSLFTYTDRVEPVGADELSVGNVIAIPAVLPCGYNDIDYLNMLELFPDGRVFAPEYVKVAVQKLGYDKASEICGVKSISDYYANFKRSKPSALQVGKFVMLMKEAGIDYNLADVYFRFDKKSNGCPGAFKLSPQLLRLMGYYVSEGSLSGSGGNSKISFYNKDKKIIEDIKYCLKRAVGFEPKERVGGWGDAVELSLSHKVLFELLKKFCGKKLGGKKIPEFVFGLSKEKIGHFLAGLYNGDGWSSKSSSKNYVFGYSTQSRELADDLLHILLTFGIVATVVDRTKESRNRGYEILFRRRKDQHKFLKYAKLLKRDVNIGEVLENPRIKNDVFLDKIKEIEVINLERETPVYDIAVSGTQNFIGGFGGVLLHNSGHPSFTTFHAGSVDTVIKRLTTPPIELSATLVESLDAIAIMVHAKERGKSARRIKTVEEIISVDPQSLNAKVFKSSEWDPATDAYKINMEGSHVIEKLAHTKGISVEEAMKEIKRRKAVLVWMFKNNIKGFEEVSKLINEFYKNPKEVLEKIGEIDLAKEEAEIEKKIRKVTPEKERGEVKTVDEEPVLEKKEMKVTTVKGEIESDEDVYRLFGYRTVKEKTKAAA